MNLPPDLPGRLLWLLNHSLQAGVLVLLVLLVQWLFRRHLTNRWRFALWWLVLLRLVLPFSPQSAVSLFNLVHPSIRLSPVAAPRQSAADQKSGTVQPPVSVSTLPESAPLSDLRPASPMPPAPAAIDSPIRKAIPSTPSIHFSLPIVITALWLTGIVVLILIVQRQLVRFYRQLSAGATPANARLIALFEECRSEFPVTRRIDLLETDAVRSPALFGLLRLRLLLPRGLDAQFERPELRYIFFHELAHVKRRDLWLNWLVTILQIMHWFNPLLWFGFARLRADRELACDELALLRAGDHVGTAYGQTVIKLLENLNRPAAIPGLIGILEDSRQMRRRIAMIARFHRPGRWSTLAALLLAVLAAVALTDAQSEKPAPNPRVNDLASSTITPQSQYDNYFTAENSMVMPGKGLILPPGTSTSLSLNVEWGRRYQVPATLAPDSSPVDLALNDASLGINLETGGASTPATGSPRHHRVVKGQVVLPNGQPAAGVDVAVLIDTANPNDDQGISSHRESLRQAGLLVSTLPDGSFSLSADTMARGLIILDSRGCAVVSFDDLLSSPQIKLQKWGRIEGTLRLGNHPCTNEWVSVNPSSYTLLTKSNLANVRMPIYIADALASTTDDQGRFVLPFVPPGKQIFGRHFTQGQNISGYSQLTILDVKPGATMMTNIADPGRIIVAKLKYNDTHMEGWHDHPRVFIRPVDYDEFAVKLSQLKTDAQRQAYLEQHWRELQNIVAGPQTNGRLIIKDIPPGQYHLEVTEPGKATSVNFVSDQILEVPPETDDNVYTPVDWGEIQLTSQVWPTPPTRTSAATNTVSTTESPSILPREVTGIILLPDGRPAANVDVAMQIDVQTDHENSYLGKGSFTHRDFLHRENLLVSTGPDGRFTLRTRANSVSVLALDERGCAQATLEQLRQNPVLKLQKWGRIEGTLTIGGRPASNEVVSVTQWDFVPGTNADPGPMFSPEAIAARTDSKGYFALSHVPPGELVLGRQGTPAEAGNFRLSTVLEVAPGTTVTTNLEDNSRAVIVRLKHHDATLSDDETSEIAVIVSPTLAELQKKYTPSGTSADLQAFHNDAEKIRSKIRAYPAFRKPDGSFRAEGVPPGEYYIHLPEEPESTNEAYLRSAHTLVVPAETGDQVAVPVNWGEVNLVEDRQRVPAPKTSEPNSAANAPTKADGAPEPATTSQPPAAQPVPDAPLTGTILLPDGRPAANVDIALQTENWENVDSYISKGKFKDRDDLHREGFLVSTGPDGRFKLGLDSHAKSILALDARGCAQVSLAQLRQNPQVQLQKWGRIEGTLRIGDRPGSNELVSVNPSSFSPRTNNTPRKILPPMYSPNALAAKTDAQGHFILTDAPPGEYFLGRHEPSGMGNRGFSELTVLEVAPGATVMTNIDDYSRVVTAMLKYRDPNLVGEGFPPLTTLETVTAVEMGKRFGRLKTDADRQAFYDDAVKNRPNFRVYLAQPGSDGSLRLEGVLPGEYYICLDELGSTNAAFFISDRTIVVPPVTDDQLAIPVNCGEVHLTEEGRRTPVIPTSEADSATATATGTENAPEPATASQPSTTQPNPNASLTGTVLLPDGQPAANVDVALQIKNGYPLFAKGTFDSRDFLRQEQLLVSTGPDGRFTLPLRQDAEAVLALDPRGCAGAPLEQFRQRPQLTLEKWSRIEGTLRVGDHPGSNEMVSVTPWPYVQPPSTNDNFLPTAALHFSADALAARTDAHGHFILTFVPPGRQILGRRWPWGQGNTSYSRAAVLQVAPGTTLVTNIDDNGRAVIATVNIPDTGRVGPKTITDVFFETTATLELEKKSSDPNLDLQTVEEYQKTNGLNLRGYSAALQPDGSFRADGVLPGRYFIQVVENNNTKDCAFFRSGPPQIVPLATGDPEAIPVTWDNVSLTTYRPQLPGTGPLTGLVLLPNGQPAPNTQVALAEDGWVPTLGWRSFYFNGSSADEPLTNTAADGSFAIPANFSARQIFAVSQAGFAQLSLKQFRADRRIQLQKWGRIEGTLILNHQIRPHERVLLQPLKPAWPLTLNWRFLGSDSTQIPSLLYDQDAYQAVTDDQGRFVFTNVPPGEQTILHKSPAAFGPINSELESLDVPSGATLVTNVGDTGRLVAGKISIDTGLVPSTPDNPAWVMITTSSTNYLAKVRHLQTAAEWLAFCRSPEAQSLRGIPRTYPARLLPDGSFSIEDVPAGQYSIDLNLITPSPASGNNGVPAFYQTTGIMTVPPAKDDHDLSAVDWGEIKLEEADRQPVPPVTNTESSAIDSIPTGSTPEPAPVSQPASPNHSPEETFSGIILSPDGQPATDAEVTVPENCRGLMLGRGNFIFRDLGNRAPWASGGPLVTTAPDGSFTLPLLPKARTIAAVSQAGFAQISLEDFLIHPRLQLQKWGRIEGTLIINHKTRPYEMLLLQPKLPPWLATLWYRSDDYLSFNSDFFRAQTDDQGNFAFAFVPPGESRVIQVPSYHELANVQVAPGVTVVTNLDGGSVPETESAPSHDMTTPPPNFKPTRDITLTGTVLLPDGQPAMNADVTVPEKCFGLTLGWGEFIFNGPGSGGPLVSTAPDGSFALPMYPNAESIAAVNKEGFAQMSLAQFHATPQLKLQKWGRIEGTLIINHQIRPHELVTLQRGDLQWLPPTQKTNNIATKIRSGFYDSDAFRAQTDDQGRFVFTFVPPGDHLLLHKIPAGKDTWIFSGLERFEVKPGATVVTNFGGTGRTVTGRIKIPDGHVPGSQYPQICLRAATSSPTTLEAGAHMRYYAAAPQPDGTFRIDDVAPGKYSVAFTVSATTAAGNPKVEFYETTGTLLVPPANNDQDDSSADWGEIKLTKEFEFPVDKPSTTLIAQ